MNITDVYSNKEIMAGVAAGSEKAITAASEIIAKSLGERLGHKTLGGTYKNIDPDHKVFLTHAIGNASSTTVESPVPPNFQLEVQSSWTPKNNVGLKDGLSALTGAISSNRASGNKGGSLASRAINAAGGKLAVGSAVVGSALDAIGMSNTTLKWYTAHFWEGSSPIKCNIPFEFIAESDPEKEVIEPMRFLYKLAAPYEKMGILMPPGPSVLGTAMGIGTKISIRIGKIFTFDNVVIDSVSGEIDTRLTKGSKKILHAKVDVSFTSFYTVSRDDVDKIFNREPSGAGTESAEENNSSGG
jgi:hypothetical protein